jgi:DNA-binding NtrC family response regulator
LTDVDSLPHEVQPELLRIMISRAPIRVISTSTVPLVKATVPEFSQELALALSTLVIEVPSLRDRQEDIPVLAQALLEQQNAAGGRQVRGFSTDALDQLAAYAWPGNLTQLAEVVRAAHAAAGGLEITPGELPERIRFASEPQRVSRRRAEPIVLAEFLAKVEAELITRALRRAKGNKARAAKLLGMTRPRLYRRMVQLGLAEAQS